MQSSHNKDRNQTDINKALALLKRCFHRGRDSSQQRKPLVDNQDDQTMINTLMISQCLVNNE